MLGLSSKQVSSDSLDCGESFNFHSSGLIEVPKGRQNQNQQPDPLRCPRCESKNTKFCYYNNYNKSQPRHYCKACKRHWTKGGTLRNVPVGGGRKNKRLKINTTSANYIATENQSHQLTQSLSLALGDQKDVFRILSHGSYGNRGNNVISNFLGNPRALPLIQDQVPPPITFSRSVPFEVESTPSLNNDNTLIELANSLEETNTIMPSTTCFSSRTWQAPGSGMDVPSFWNWDDVDPLVSADQLNINWDDSNEIKP